MQAVPFVLDMLLCYNIERTATETSLGRKCFCYSPANKMGTQLFSSVSICSNFPNVNYYTLNENNIKQYIGLMKKKYISYWHQTLQHSQKLSFYYTIKKTFGLSAYLDLTRKNASRKALVKLRISSHKLLIETGRYDNIPRNERACNVCNRKTIEDEIHFLLDCPSLCSFLK